ncbi:hypothetical protein T265_01009 [Opisthorchis viverrini]|uniref:Uncharacterized protein n=1 Tax=Opisthorchis viverrini TaxID=6198 RepID=A0A075AJC0_OPIVI|nr:hypothetical protein T265_01009 [Opisthorchis viverrini]KER33119.1 hypothetical protein T265_01009 [Opisthorchis viverrini]
MGHPCSALSVALMQDFDGYTTHIVDSYVFDDEKKAVRSFPSKPERILYYVLVGKRLDFLYAIVVRPLIICPRNTRLNEDPIVIATAGAVASTMLRRYTVASYLEDLRCALGGLVQTPPTYCFILSPFHRKPTTHIVDYSDGKTGDTVMNKLIVYVNGIWKKSLSPQPFGDGDVRTSLEDFEDVAEAAGLDADWS